MGESAGKPNNESRWVALSAIAAILSACIACIALIPAFGQLQQARSPEQKIIERERVVTVQLPVKTIAAANNTEDTQQLRFCNENMFDSRMMQCTASQNIFNGIVKAVYVSWQTDTPSQNFTRIWYLNGREIKRTTSQGISAKFEVETLNSLLKGNYSVDLYVGLQLIGSGTFSIQ